MNSTTIWIMQGILAGIMTTSGIVILVLPKRLLEDRLSWVKSYPYGMKLFICLAKIAGALGLILPMLLNTLPIVTAYAAMGIALLMIAAFVYHLQTKEYKDIPATILILIVALLISYYRF